MRISLGLGLLVGVLALGGCSTKPPSPDCAAGSTSLRGGNLEQRAYVVSRDSGEITVIDLETLELAGTIDTCGRQNHMLELSADFTTAYVTSAETDETIVVDVRSSQVIERIAVAHEPTHLNMSRDGKLLAIMNEGENAVTFIDTATNTIKKRLDGFFVPHFIRFAPNMKHAYVANIGAFHISRIDLERLEVDATIPLDGYDGETVAPDEGGFADVQIDQDGVLYAAHASTGRVLVYDTWKNEKIGEVRVGNLPWIVYAEHPFTNVRARVVPNFREQNVSVISAGEPVVQGFIGGADHESYGVNYSPLVPERAWVMNRMRQDIAVIDTVKQQQIATIPVGGNTETASTTADGKYIVATVSSANRVVVIDALTNAIVKTFDNVGKYPWSVTIPNGQNYCH